MSLFWVIIILALSIIEVATINLVTIWYVASAIVALITSFFIDSFEIEFSIFVILGTIFLVTTKKTLDKLVKEHHEKTNLDRIVGMEFQEIKLELLKLMEKSGVQQQIKK